MTAEKVKETLKREEKHFVEIQRAAEQQLTILKVHVQKWGGTSCSQESNITSLSSSHQQSYDPIIRPLLSKVREGEELPELELDVTSQTIRSEPMVIVEEDEIEYVEVEEEEKEGD